MSGHLSSMVQAAVDGKIAEFEKSFHHAMAAKVDAAIQVVKQDIGSSLTIDGEEVTDADE